MGDLDFANLLVHVPVGISAFRFRPSFGICSSTFDISRRVNHYPNRFRVIRVIRGPEHPGGRSLHNGFFGQIRRADIDWRISAWRGPGWHRALANGLFGVENKVHRQPSSANGIDAQSLPSHRGWRKCGSEAKLLPCGVGGEGGENQSAAPTISDLSHRYLWNSQAVDQLFAGEKVTSLGTAGTMLWALTDHENSARDLITYNSNSDVTTVANHRVFDSYGNLESETDSAVDRLKPLMKQRNGRKQLVMQQKIYGKRLAPTEIMQPPTEASDADNKHVDYRSLFSSDHTVNAQMTSGWNPLASLENRGQPPWSNSLVLDIALLT